jgi:hypothetical protein
LGIEITFGREGHAGTRVITLRAARLNQGGVCASGEAPPAKRK